VTRGSLAARELRIRLGALLRGVRAAAARRAERTAALARPELSHLAITAQHAKTLLDQADAFGREGRAYGPGTQLAREELEALADVEHQAQGVGFELPGRALRRRGLSELDLSLLIAVAAPAIEPSFGALYGYLHDVAAAGWATPVLAVDVLATDADHERRVLEAAGPFGFLRLEGLVLAGPSERPPPGSQLRPADGIVELLWGGAIDVGLLGRRSRAPTGRALPPALDAELVQSLADGLGSGELEVVGVWGPRGGGAETVVAALVGASASLRAGSLAPEVALQRACLAEAVCVIDVPADPEEAAALADAVAASSARVVLTGDEPLRTAALWAQRRCAELTVPTPRFSDRRASWSAALPELDPNGVDDLAARFRLLPQEVDAVASLDRTARVWARNGQRPAIETLAGLVSRRRSPRVATVRSPRRGPDLLVLPAEQLAQVLEVASAARAWPRVAERWKLDRFGNPGVTALFTGEPGTGKTLAAEVIASLVALDLMVVDLSRLVSKWLGETEKNLDAVFREAEATSCVLFFDEADSLFGPRGEVTRGADRYANLEVGFLLQRLEAYEGLVILATNLQSNLDSAFTRRFHHVVHFPKPAEAERRRLWELMLGPPVTIEPALDLDVLSRLELTGAGIAAIVRSAALASHADGRSSLSARDLVVATARQFQREARLLPREELGAYAELVG
jgi:hypothetical protein